MYQRDVFCAPTVCPTAPTSPTKVKSGLSLCFYCGVCMGCRAHCRGCRAHCRGTQIVPLVHGLTLVSYISVPSIIERSKQSLKAPKSIISLSCIFFGTPSKSWSYHVWLGLPYLGCAITWNCLIPLFEWNCINLCFRYSVSLFSNCYGYWIKISCPADLCIKWSCIEILNSQGKFFIFRENAEISLSHYNF